MGVRVIETDPDAYDVEDCASACYSYVTTATTTPPSSIAKTPPLNTASAETRTEMPIISRSSKDLVGNCKEFRIEHNKSDLRIIGNSNRIRIVSNDGNLQIIGNSTRLKILSNAGHIKYTGNDGRISLGGDSTQQLVEYVGCNGLLKVVTSGSDAKPPATCFTIIDDITKSPCGDPATVTLKTPAIPTALASTLRTTKCKSASYGGMDKNSHWQQFNELFKRRCSSASVPGAASSMPNLKENNYQHNNNNNNSNNNNNGSSRQCFHINKSINCVGDIVIRNAVNLSANSQ